MQTARFRQLVKGIGGLGVIVVALATAAPVRAQYTFVGLDGAPITSNAAGRAAITALVGGSPPFATVNWGSAAPGLVPAPGGGVLMPTGSYFSQSATGAAVTLGTPTNNNAGIALDIAGVTYTDSQLAVGDSLLYNNIDPGNAPLGGGAITVDLQGMRTIGLGFRVETGLSGTSGFTLDVLGDNLQVLQSQAYSITYTYNGTTRDLARFIGVVGPPFRGIRLTATSGPSSVNQSFGISDIFLIIPEPTSIALFGVGLVGLAGYGWKKKKPASQ